MTATLPVTAELLVRVAGRGHHSLGVLLPPLPRPQSPHRLTRWGDRLGAVHVVCSCSPDVDPATPACVDWSRLRDLLHRTLDLAMARQDVKPRSWPEPEHPAPLKAAARRQRGMALLGLILSGQPQLECGGPSVSELHPAEPSPEALSDASRQDPGDASEHAEAPRPEPEPAPDRGGRQVPQVGRSTEAVRGAVADATAPAPKLSSGAPWRWYAPGWQKPPRCHSCGLHHYQRWAGGGHLRPCTKDDPVTATYAVCRECGWTLDPVAAELFAGRHAECSLPLAERQLWTAQVREHGRLRRAAERTDR